MFPKYFLGHYHLFKTLRVAEFATKMQDKKTWLTVSILKFVPDRPMRVHCTVFNDAFPSPKLSEPIKITFKDFVAATVRKFRQHDRLELACEPPGQVGTLSCSGDSAVLHSAHCR